MRLSKIKSKNKKYEGGGFASASGIGMEKPVLNQTDTIDKDKKERFTNVAGTASKGAALGASVGSAVPGIGTAVGAVAGALGGAAVGLIGNRKQEKLRKKQNAEIEAANQAAQQENTRQWQQYANAEDSYNIQRATDSGYDAMGNASAQFYGKAGGRLSKQKYPGGGKVYHTTSNGVNLSRSEYENLQQFKGDQNLYNQAMWEMVGYSPSNKKFPSGSDNYKKNIKEQEDAVKKFNDGYAEDRQTAAPNSFKNLSSKAVDKNINPNLETNKKLTAYQTDYNTENQITDQTITDNAAKNIDINAVKPSDANLEAGKSYAYENPEGFKKGGRLVQGGKLSQLNSNTVKATGNTHAEGGIQLTPNAEIEDAEVVTDKGNSLFISSATLKNPSTGNTFAKDDEKISKKIAVYENKEATPQNKNALKMLEAKKANLETTQQSMNGNHTGTTMKDGGRISKLKAVNGAVLPYVPQSTLTSPYSTATGAADLADAQKTGFTGGAALKGALPGIAQTVGNAVVNYGSAFLEYGNQKKQIKKLEALKIPDPILNSYVNLGRQNMDVDKANVNRDVAALNTGADRSFTDSNTAAAYKAANLGKGLEVKASINQAERNQNQQIANQESQINLQTQMGNNNSLMDKKNKEFQKQADVINMKGEAFSKLLENIRGGQNTARQEKHVNNQFALDAYRLPDQDRKDLGEYLKKNNTTVWGKTPNFKKGGRLSKMKS